MSLQANLSTNLYRCLPRCFVGVLVALVLSGSGGKGVATPSSKPARTQKRRYALQELVDRARRHYPGVAAAHHDLESMERQLFRAKWAWLPRGRISGMVAPTPEIQCLDAAGNRNENQCVETNVRNFSLKLNGFFGRVQLDLGMPLYTFDKLGSARRAAEAGVVAKKAGIVAAEQDVVLNVTKAYWGVKLAREVLYTIRDGRKHLDRAIARIDREIDEGTGDSTLTDLLRLKTHAAEIDARTVEAEKLERLALASLATIVGLDRGSFDVDGEILALVAGEPLAVEHYLGQARQHRPEVKMLQAATAASEARVSLAKARFFPDLLLVGRVGVGAATNIDDPKNSFYNDPFNFFTTALALSLSWNLDTVQQYGELKSASAEARRTHAKRQEAVGAIELEIQQAYLELREARERLVATRRGQKSAKSWLVATSQNLEAGTVEPKELTDALVAFFTLRLHYLEALFKVNLGWAKLTRVVGLRDSLSDSGRSAHRQTDRELGSLSRHAVDR